MKSSPPANEKFRRLSLADQIADSLRKAICSGELSKHLPPERELCRKFNASRPVIRQSLHTLQDLGLLKIRTARTPEIIRKSPSIRKMSKSKRAVLVFAEKNSVLGQWTLSVIDEIRRELYTQGVHFDLVMEPELTSKIRLQRLVERHQADYWILAGSSVKIQEYFQQQPLKVVSMGNAFPQTRIPFVNDDLRGTTRHAAGVFLGMGHQQIVFLMREEGTAGEAATLAGFREAFRLKSAAEGVVIKHSGQVEAIHEQLQKGLSRHPTATALLISHAEDTLVTMNWLLKQGIRVPQDVSLISYQWENYLDRLRPLPAWYYTDPKLHAHKLCRLMLHPPLKKGYSNLIIPTFFKNDTIAAANSSRSRTTGTRR